VAKHVDNWKFWMTLSGLGLGAAYVLLFFVFQREARADALRQADVRAAASAAVSSCYSSLKNEPVVAGFIRTQRLLIDDQILTNHAALATEKPGDPLRAVRMAHLKRLQVARGSLGALNELIVGSQPSHAKCLALAKGLHVLVPKNN
jgi:hypothetical protein